MRRYPPLPITHVLSGPRTGASVLRLAKAGSQSGQPGRKADSRSGPLKRTTEAGSRQADTRSGQLKRATKAGWQSTRTGKRSPPPVPPRSPPRSPPPSPPPSLPPSPPPSPPSTCGRRPYRCHRRHPGCRWSPSWPARWTIFVSAGGLCSCLCMPARVSAGGSLFACSDGFSCGLHVLCPCSVCVLKVSHSVSLDIPGYLKRLDIPGYLGIPGIPCLEFREFQEMYV